MNEGERMNSREPPAARNESRKSSWKIWLPIAVILLPLAYSLVSFVTAGGKPSGQPVLERPAPQYEQCVRDTEYMRYHHWELLNAVREDFVRHGQRGDIRFSRCRECHPNREGFCNQCHNQVNLQPDCFGCHYYPDSPQTANAEGQAGPLRSNTSSTVTTTASVPGR